MRISYYPKYRFLGGPSWILPRVWMTHRWTTLAFMVGWAKRNLQIYIKVPRPIRGWLKRAYNSRAE